jgi:hypothetical protein
MNTTEVLEVVTYVVVGGGALIFAIDRIIRGSRRSSFLTRCTECKHKFELTDQELIGDRMKCPSCKKQFKVRKLQPKVRKSEKKT